MRTTLSLLALLAAAVGSTGADASTQYVLRDFSLTEEGCFEPCMCPILALFLAGTFELTPTGPDGEFETFSIDNIDWVATVGGPVINAVTGSGTFRVGDEQQRLELDLQFDGGEVEHYDSGLVPAAAEFPEIDVLASVGDLVCYDEVVVLRAAPLAPGYLALSVDPQNLYWSIAPGAASYEVVTGNMAYLRTSDGDFAAATDACLGDGLETPVLAHGTTPADEAIWFLVRGLPAATYDSQGIAQRDPRDAQIDSAPPACP